ncbi:MAG: flagellar basal body P-ring protein FlgI [Buchnera aphidicola (Kaburagia rhusicola ensigallis)]
MFKKYLLKCIFIVLVIIHPSVYADKIRDLMTIQGTRDNQLIGYGLIAGLDGTGDDTQYIPYTMHTLQNMLSQLGIGFTSEKNMQLKNIAAVMVTAKYPSFIHLGQKIDVNVSSIGNAKSLKGGTLLMTPLKSIDNKIYAIAQGNVSIDEIYYPKNVLNKTIKNQYNSGKIIDGAIIEREINNNFGKSQIVVLQLHDEDFTVVQKISDLINTKYPNTAVALNSRTIQLYTPEDSTVQVRMLSTIQDIDVDLPIQNAKIIINTKTGDIVMNHEVKINSCAVAHGNMSMIINATKNVQYHSDNSANHMDNNDLKNKKNDLNNYNSHHEIKYINKVTHLNNIVRALNSLGIKPIELISILQAMQNVGCLRAKLEII